MSHTQITELFDKELIREVFESILENEITSSSQTEESSEFHEQSDELNAFLNDKRHINEEISKTLNSQTKKTMNITIQKKKNENNPYDFQNVTIEMEDVEYVSEVLIGFEDFLKAVFEVNRDQHLTLETEEEKENYQEEDEDEKEYQTFEDVILTDLNDFVENHDNYERAIYDLRGKLTEFHKIVNKFISKLPSNYDKYAAYDAIYDQNDDKII